ncbi:MAG: hypothetical protein IJU76_11050 [Desulfovibrionaceae bacterium]|nr:hypothetical protein [Desulfovibrionaceae bacterium]
MLNKDVQRTIGFLAEMGAASMSFWAQGPVTQGLLGKKGGVDIVCLALALQTCVPKKNSVFSAQKLWPSKGIQRPEAIVRRKNRA